MGEECCGMPAPTPEHAKIQKNVGVWDVDMKHFMEPGKPPLDTKGVETTSALGPFWTVGVYQCSFMGQPFEGRSTLGYNPRTKRYISTWVDCMMPHLYVLEGNYDSSGRVLTMTGEGPSMHGPELTTWKSVCEHISDDEMLFRMFIEGEHGEYKIMESRYHRRK